MRFTPVREDLAWAAGFFDGEGCFSRARSYQGQVQVVQKTVPLLLRFRAAVGLGHITGPYRHARRNPESTQYHFRAGAFEDVQAIIAMLWPWLGDYKKEQAKSILTRWRR